MNLKEEIRDLAGLEIMDESVGKNIMLLVLGSFLGATLPTAGKDAKWAYDLYRSQKNKEIVQQYIQKYGYAPLSDTTFDGMLNKFEYRFVTKDSTGKLIIVDVPKDAFKYSIIKYNDFENTVHNIKEKHRIKKIMSK